MLFIGFCILTLATWTLSQAVYVLLMALVGRRLGLAVQKVEVGYGPTIWSGTLFGFPFRYALVPLGGFTKFEGRDELSRRTGAESVNQPLTLEEAPWTCLATVLIGPLSSIAIGIALLAMATTLGGPRLAVNDSDDKIIPTAVPMLAIESARPTLDSQRQLFHATGYEFLRRLALLRPMPNWSGPIGFIYTTAVAGDRSFSAWLSLVGVSILAAGLANLLPFPVLNGWHALRAFFKGLLRLEIPDTVNAWLMLAGMLYLLVVLGGRMMLLDILWIGSVISSIRN